MASVTATRVTCPECGATINATGDAVKCEYCGTTARVQRRTTVFEIPQRMKPAEPHHPKPVAREVRVRSWPVVLLVLAVIAFPIAIVASVSIASGRRFLIDGYLRITDADGDGTADVLVWARYIKGDRMKLRMISGKDGHEIWQTDSLGTYLESYESAFAITNGVIIRGNQKSTTLDGFDLKTGAKLWSVAMQEALQYSCDTGGVVVLKDKSVFAVDPKTGALSPGTDTCGKTNTSYDTEMKLRQSPIMGMSWDRYYGDHSPYIVSGHKDPGTNVPMIAALETAGAVVWRDTIASHDPMQSKDCHVQVKDDLAAGVCEWTKDTQDPEVTAWDRHTGKRLWTATAKYSGHMFVSLHGIGIGNDLVIVTVNESVQGFDPKTGKRRFVVGETD
ncbi:MAG: PQQ-binding-like beta-propeller repeat protein [Kofleriaceae bacterium]